MALKEEVRVTFHPNGSITKYHSWKDVDKPKVEQVGMGYHFNFGITKVEHIQAKRS